MTPDANDLCVFAVKRGDIENRFDINYNLPKYASLINKLRNAFGDRLKTIGQIADVICGPFGSAIKSNDYQDDGIPLVRITNISKDGYMDYSDLVYISDSLGNSLARTQVSAGDIVISQRGSLGQCAVVDGKYPKLNISANIIAIKNIRETSAGFIHDYLLSSFGQKMLERSTSGQVQQKITTQDILDVLIPIGCDEESLSRHIKKAYRIFKSKLKNADDAIISARKQILGQIGIVFPNYHPSLYSYFRLGQIKEIGLNCNPHSAYLNEVFSKLHNSPFYSGLLEDFVDVNPTINRTLLNDSSVVSFVPMPAVSEKTNQVVYEQKQYKDVKTGFTPFQRGDLLWAKITPCMQNGKSFLSDRMSTEFGFGSTEFHVLRQKSERIYMPFLWVLLSDGHILEAAQGMFSGSAGQQRIPDTFLKKFPIILPPIELQKELADEVLEALDQAKRMNETAEKEWSEAKAQFEKELLGE